MTPTLPIEIVIAGLGIVGNVLVAHQKSSGLWLWLLSNLIALPLMLYTSMYGMAALYFVYAITTLYSLVQWRRIANTHTTNEPDVRPGVV